MIDLADIFIKYFQAAVAAATPYMAGAAMVAIAICLVLLATKGRPFDRMLKRFSGVALTWKVALVVAICLVVRLGGSKERSGDTLPDNIVVEDPEGLFGTYYTSVTFAGAGKVATVAVYTVTGISICKPDDSSWAELEASRVVLDDEELRIRIDVAPQLKSLAQCRQAFGDSLVVRTSGTCPSGAYVPFDNDTVIVNSSDRSEIRITKTRQQLKAFGLLPMNDKDGVDEMAWLDSAVLIVESGQDLLDSEAFAGLSYEDRGISCRDQSRTLESAPPNSLPSKSYFKAAGREIVDASYGGIRSAKRQVMNQADYFYVSGHGSHSNGEIHGGFTAANAMGYWGRDLDVVVIAGCSVLDINDYNGNYDGVDHSRSPGRHGSGLAPRTSSDMPTSLRVTEAVHQRASCSPGWQTAERWETWALG